MNPWVNRGRCGSFQDKKLRLLLLFGRCNMFLIVRFVQAVMLPLFKRSLPQNCTPTAFGDEPHHT